MKKLLLLSILFSLAVLNGYSFVWLGPDNVDVYSGSSSEFYYNNSEGVTTMYYSKWTVENGRFSGKSFGEPLFLGPSTFQRVFVEWLDPNKPGKVTVELSKASGAELIVKHTWNVNVIQYVDPPKPPVIGEFTGDGKNIIGPSELVSGNIVTYTYGGKYYYDADRSRFSWAEEYFDLIDIKHYQDSMSITLKVKENLDIEKESLITYIGIEYYATYFHGDWSRGGNARRVKIYSFENLSINNNNDDIICNNENMTFNITGFPSENIENRSVILWETVSNSSLTSGQGTKTATFKASGNGYAKVKATVKYNGLTYNLENSDVWVGAPAAPVINGLKEQGDYSQRTTYMLSAVQNPIHTSEITDSYIWSISGNATLKYNSRPLDNSKVNLTTDQLPSRKSGFFRLLLTSENRCGISPITVREGIISSSLTLPGTDPQPVSLSLRSGIEIGYNIKIYSFTTGQIVYQEKKAVDFKIENTNLHSGVYIIEKTDSYGNITKIKVKKN